VTPARRTVAVDGREIRVLTGGDGPPLVYLHSLGADVDWLEAHDRLATRFTVYLPAHPGFAESTGGEEMEGIFDLVLHYVDLLAALRLGAVPVVGTSFGAWIAAELGALYPERIGRLVLVDAVGIWLDAVPMGELFGSTPPELARMLFHDQEHPIPKMMSAITSFGQIPEEIALPQIKAMEIGARIGWNPGGAPARHRALRASAGHRASRGVRRLRARVPPRSLSAAFGWRGCPGSGPTRGRSAARPGGRCADTPATTGACRGGRSSRR
jgi:pimeloyl-ACP methyl ester carboxylesterase